MSGNAKLIAAIEGPSAHCGATETDLHHEPITEIREVERRVAKSESEGEQQMLAGRHPITLGHHQLPVSFDVINPGGTQGAEVAELY